MTLIQLSQIKPSPHPIRKSWDEDKMEELKWSLMEEGQVEAIGVHENSHGYIIVWGHRRVEAARRAGWKEIEAFIVAQDEINNLIQAGIENLSGEDMSDKDKADWVYRLNIGHGLSLREISRRSSVPFSNIQRWSTMKRQSDLGVQVTRVGQPNTAAHVTEIVAALGDDLEAKKAVAARVSNDKFDTDITRAVAEAYRDAPTPEIKKKILETPIQTRDTAADILRRSMHKVEMEKGYESVKEMNDWQKEREERRTYENFNFAVKEFLDAANLFLEVARKGSALVKYGKYSPEAARFAIRKIDMLIDALKNYREELENVQ